ncbi:division/cell wall cluster transcriptional repressor MraZ [Candidatus Liberibacter sp.]|uniref:division/cell wall cluster transcriptional repressor MraZ n=1 Tax=Candidatus Liberibacter sp. TaxID=34022 RepID=UPI0015F394D6|nr:division/cell wall cluster transcriptional repressor MraZ [Candidatus Liberibacter sp.]MBA5724064.1 division/cell wall cluster transcriptional repressor MraZ [Candidatus Liberibacter sp.]
MSRFLSNATKKIDAKGRVSVPSAFRAILIERGISKLYCFQDFFFPAISIGDSKLLERFEQKIEEYDSFSIKANQLSLLIHGGGIFLKVDSEGRFMVTDFIREFAGIENEVTFVGRADHFQLWNPETFKAMQDEARNERWPRISQK